jgi:hypothetical protein
MPDEQHGVAASGATGDNGRAVAGRASRVGRRRGQAPKRPGSVGRVEREPGDAAEGDRADRWSTAVAAIRSSPALREDILQSVMTSMAFEGFAVDRRRSEELLERALDGRPIEQPGEA